MRERALRLFAKHRQDYPSDTGLAEAVAKKVGGATAIAATVFAVAPSRFAICGFTGTAIRNRQHVEAGVVA